MVKAGGRGGRLSLTHTAVCLSGCWAARWWGGSCSSHCPQSAGSEPRSAWSPWSSPGPLWSNNSVMCPHCKHPTVDERGGLVIWPPLPLTVCSSIKTHLIVTQIHFTDFNVCGCDSPLREEGIDDSVSQRIDGQLWDPLEIFSTAGPTKFEAI